MKAIQKSATATLEAAILPLWGICCLGVLLFDLTSGRKAYLLVPGFLGILLLGFFCQRFLKSCRLQIFVLICGLIFLAVQIVLVLSYYFETGWDSQGIVAAAEQFARREKVTAYPFSRFPNNLIMTILYSRVFRIAFSLGRSRDQGYQMILVIQCVLFFVTGQLTFSAARKIVGKDSLALTAFFAYLVLIGLSPWVSILYSDPLGIFFPIAVLWLYLMTSECRKPAILWLLVGFLSFVGYRIKPTAMIVFIAICIVELLNTARHREVKRLVFALAGLFVGMAVCSAVVSLSGYSIDKERSFGPAHFFMMGLNEEHGGTWAGDDQVFSMTFPTAKERTQGDLERAKARLKEMGARRLWKHIVRKMRIDYNDGTFSWGGEGNFYRLIREETDPVLSPWIRSFYYHEGDNYALFANTEHAVWLGVLLLSIFSAFAKADAGRSATGLSLLGMHLYLLLFEARARYLFVYGPFYILLAALGLRVILEKLKKKDAGV